MDAETQSKVAFFLTGRRQGDLAAVMPDALRPALLARYRDLAALRYDFPLVLANGPDDEVMALSALVDRALSDIAHGEDGDRIARQAVRQERALRTLLAEGRSGTLLELWDVAAARVGASADDPPNNLSRVRGALRVDGELVDCDRALPARLFAHLWRSTQQAKAARFRAVAARLIQKLSDIVRADDARSEAGRSAGRLRASVGGVHADLFDFDAMSRLLARAAPASGLAPARRARIDALLAVLSAQRFHPVDGDAGASPYSFAYTSCVEALAAYRERLPEMASVARAMAMAELEIAGEYREAAHGALADSLGADALRAEDVATFPDYLVVVDAGRLDASEQAALTEALAAGLPMKILLCSDDILEESPAGDGLPGFGARARQFAHLAMGQNDVYVLQSTASNLYPWRDRVRRGLCYAGPALFCVYSGATPTMDALPPFLCAAAATDSRAFPAFAYDPGAGADWATRFDLDGNPDVEFDWPVRRLCYEDEAQQTVAQDVAFTVLDFVACDRRYAKHFACLLPAPASPDLVPAAEGIAAAPGGLPERVPYLLMVDGDDRLQQVLVDERLVRAARRCHEAWHSLQELGGVHNSHAAREVARERAQLQQQPSGGTAAPAAAPATAQVAEAKAKAATPAAGAAGPPTAGPAEASDEPYIETARCTTCNECTTINPRMFAYNENRQAYIADVTAGSFAQLVEAAESCQVSIIHPGKPRDSNEAGIDELVRRAEPFR